MNVTIIDYGAGNVRSVQFALERLGINAICSDDAETITHADKVIFPGVGQAGAAMEQLKKRNLDRLIPDLQQPVLGICLGMQLLCAWSEEGDTKGLGIFPERVIRFEEHLKVPHMGWNALQQPDTGLFSGIDSDSYAYFVHSYYVPVHQYTIAGCTYGIPFSAALHKDNFYACQFHPEKSAAAGATLLQNFISL